MNPYIKVQIESKGRLYILNIPFLLESINRNNAFSERANNKILMPIGT